LRILRRRDVEIIRAQDCLCRGPSRYSGLEIQADPGKAQIALSVAEGVARDREIRKAVGIGPDIAVTARVIVQLDVAPVDRGLASQPPAPRFWAWFFSISIKRQTG
jgi:hypothetical protein